MNDSPSSMSEQIGDAWGRALLDQFHGNPLQPLHLEVDDGTVVPMMQPAWFFRSYEEWDWWDQELLPMVARGPVLDLGAGAGRAALYMRHRGFDVTAVESSSGAAEVCRQRGVSDVRVGDLNDPPTHRAWQAVLLLCGNLGLGGSWERNRSLLHRLADITPADAVLIGDSVNYEGPAEIGLRIRYGGVVTPWWRQRNVSSDEVPDLVRGTGWVIDRHLVDGTDHAVLLRKQ